MARIAGVDLPDNKRLPYALSHLYGVGIPRGIALAVRAGIDPSTKLKDLTEAELARLRELIDEKPVEGDLRRQVNADIRRLMEIGSFRGVRHRRGLPVRGQRTRTNARTRKGPRKTIGRKRAAPTKA